jgi:hypothetical protein
MGSDEDFILSMLPSLDIRPLVQESWVVGAIHQVGAGILPKTKVEELFVKLAFQYLAELAYTEQLQEENAHLQSMQFVD